MVTKSDFEATCWPTETQEHLLKAVLLKDQRAYGEWKKWSACVNFFGDSLSGGIYELLPLLYNNFQALGIKDPLSGRLRGVVRNTWTRNQLFMQQVVPVLLTLENAGIRTLLLHKAALMLASYEDFGMCLLDAFDIYISPLDLERSRDLISQTGVWFPGNRTEKHKIPSANRPVEMLFMDKQERRLQVHSHLPLPGTSSYAGQDVWDSAVCFRFQNIDTHTLGPTDQVLAMLFDGLLINRILTVDWIAHIAAIITAVDPVTGWKNLISVAREHYLVLAVRNTLHYLAQKLEIAIPTTQLEVLDDLPVSQYEKREWCAITQARSGRGFRYQRLRRMWYGYMRMRAISGWRRFNLAHIYAYFGDIRR